MIEQTTLICPKCSHEETHRLHDNLSPFSYHCAQCKLKVKIAKGDCCIYCRFADIPCLKAQEVGSACCAGE